MQNEKQNARKSLYLALSILVAVVIWLYVDEIGAGTGTPRLVRKEFDDIPIEYTHEEALTDLGLMLVDQDSDQTISIRLEAPRRLMSEIDPGKIHVTADLSDITEAGLQTVQPRLTYSGYRLIGGQRLIISQSMIKEMNPYSATVNIGELNSKPVEVRCELRGNVAEGYSAGQLRMSDTVIEIWGQAEDIDPVSYAKITLDIGDGAVTSVSEELPITFYNEQNEPVDGTGIRSTVDHIRVSMPVSVTKELRLAVNFKEAPGVRRKNIKVDIQPKSITVSGDASQLNGMDTIILTDFNLLELKEKNGYGVYEYPITVPEGCSNLSGVTRATMSIALTDMASSEVTTDRFVYHHVPEGKHVEILTEEMTVSFFGTKADVEAVTPDQVTVIADLSDYSGASGSYSIPAKVEIAGDVGISGDYEIRVVIREQRTDEAENESE